METKPKTLLDMHSVHEAKRNIQAVVKTSPLMRIDSLSEKYQAEILFKREDLQTVRSYKIRGAFNKIVKLNPADRARGLVCASAGNHAQGFALACKTLDLNGIVFMPLNTPKQKVQQVQRFGYQNIEIKLIGDTFDACSDAARTFTKKGNQVFIHPFDDWDIIAGQATVGLEILEQESKPIDFLFLPIGGGGLAAGVSSVFKQLSPSTQIIGLEPKGAASFSYSLQMGKNTALDKIDKFVDGAAVKKMGEKTYGLCQLNVDKVQTVEEGHLCSALLQVYNENAIVVEPAGALSIAALDLYKEKLKNKRVVCIISGGNNDITRMEEIKERSLLYLGLKHYFIVNFSQRAGSLKEFLLNVLGPNDDISYFQYIKKNSKENGPAVVGIELNEKSDFEPLLQRMKKNKFFDRYLNDKPELFHYLV